MIGARYFRTSRPSLASLEHAGVDSGFAQDGQRFRAAQRISTPLAASAAPIAGRWRPATGAPPAALGGVAGAIAVGLGVVDDGHNLGRIGGIVDIYMAIAIEVLIIGHPRIAGDALDEALCRRRGTITSTNSGMAISSPTAARSVVR